MKDGEDLGLAAAILTCPHPTPTCTSPRGVLCCQTPIHHLQQATHTFPCLRWLGDGATAPPFASPYTYTSHMSAIHIAAEKTTDTSDQDKMVGEIFSFVCLVCVLCTKRGPLFFAGRCGGGEEGEEGGGEREENPKCHEICFPFPPWLLRDITQQKKDASEKKRVPYTDCHTKHPSSVPQGTPRHPHPVIHPPMVVMRRRLQCCCCSC